MCAELSNHGRFGGCLPGCLGGGRAAVMTDERVFILLFLFIIVG